MATGVALSATLVLAPTIASADPDAVKEAQRKVNTLREEGSKIDLEHAQLTEKLARANTKVAVLERDVAAQRTKVASMKTGMNRLALAQYQQSGLGITATLLSSPDDTSMLSRLATMQSQEARRNARLQAMQSEQGRLQSLERDLVTTRDRIKADQVKQGELAKAYTKKIDAAEAVLAKLSAEEKARLKKLQKEEAARQLAATRKADAEREARLRQQNTDTQDGQTPNSQEQDAPGGKKGFGSEQSSDQAPASSSGAATAIAYAKAQIGKAYVSGAEGPDAFDCSGLTSAAWSRAGVSLPRTSQEQAGAGVQVSLANIQPGDLVIFYGGATHVGIYVGGGMLVDAANPRAGVRMIPLANSWMPIHSIRRVG